MSSNNQETTLKTDLQRLVSINLERGQLRELRKSWDKQERRRLERTAWNALFMSLFSPYVTSIENCFPTRDFSEDSELKIYDDLLTETYHLKVVGKAKDGKRVEALLEKLKGRSINPNVIRFLLSLAWSVESFETGSTLQLYNYELPRIGNELEAGQGLFGAFDEPKNHGLERFFNQSMFEEDHQKSYNIFVEKPGSHFEAKKSHFIWKTNDEEELCLKTKPLFGALSRSNTNSLEMTLEIPTLNQDSSNEIFPSNKTLTETFEDEGFVEESNSTESIVSKVTNEISESFDDLHIWKYGSDFKEVKYTWEKLHGCDLKQDQPFLTENGPIAFDCLNRVRQYETFLLTSNPSNELKLSEKEIVRHSLNVLLGLSSRMYLFNKTKCSFDVDSRIVTPGLSCESLKNLTKEFANIGSFYRQLNKFIDHHSQNLSGLSGGLTLEAFVSSIQTYMNAFKSAVMKVQEHEDSSLIKLSMLFRQTEKQLKFLADLCLCSVAFGRQKNAPKPKFPMGLKLLSYIHNLCQKNRATTHYPVLLHIYQCAAAPFLRSVSDWIFRGYCSDVNAEFFVEVNDHYLAYRDKHYWTHGFKEKQNRADLSMFPADLVEQIFSCGKTINLLKNTCPQHYLLQSNFDLPLIDITLSMEELEKVQEKCKNYMENVHLAFQNEEERKKAQIEQEDLIKRERIIEERKKVEKSLEMINDLENKVKLAIQQKKDNELAFLKNQMLQAVEERKRANKERMEKDVEFIKMAEKGESDEAERIKQEREALLSFYGELSLAAEKRESRALWTVRRYELRQKRKQFLEKEQERLTTELNDHRGLESGANEVTEVTSKNNDVESRNSNEVKNDDVVSPEGIMLIEESQEDESSKLDSMIKDFAMSLPATSPPEDDGANNLKKEAEAKGVVFSEKADENENAVDLAIGFKKKAEGGATKDLMYGSEKPGETHDWEMGTAKNIEVGSKREVADIDEQRSPNELAAGYRKIAEGGETRSLLYSNEPVENHLSQAETNDTASSLIKGGEIGPGKEETSSELAIDNRNAAQGAKTKALMYSNEHSEATPIQAQNTIVRDDRFWDIEQAKSLKKDSTLQTVLYPEKYSDGVEPDVLKKRRESPSRMKSLLYHQNKDDEKYEKAEIVPHQLTEAELWMDMTTEPFQDSYESMHALPNTDLIAGLKINEEFGDNSEEIDAVSQLPIEIILQRSLCIPLKAQVSVVQDAIVKYFINDLQIGVHFSAFRKFLLLEDGEFGHSLCNQIFDKAFSGSSPREFCTPTVLNNMISKAIQLSLFADKLEFSRQLTFSFKTIPELLKSTDIGALDFLELRYRVPWPCNIVVTENCVSKYNKVYSFLLRLKKANWALQAIWNNLNNAGNSGKMSNQLRTLQLYRYEMQHFVNNVERYLVNQIIHISWQEFQYNLQNQVNDLDDLHKVHVNYLNKIIYRSLLNKNAAPVFKIISDIFSLILKMHVQLLSSPWEHESKMVTHPSFKSMCLTYNAFHEYAGFLFKVVSKLVQRGYQRHLDAFLLQVNFNGYYDDLTL